MARIEEPGYGKRKLILSPDCLLPASADVGNLMSDHEYQLKIAPAN